MLFGLIKKLDRLLSKFGGPGDIRTKAPQFVAVGNKRMVVEKDMYRLTYKVYCTQCKKIVMEIPREQMLQMEKTGNMDELILLTKDHACFREEGVDENRDLVRMIRA